MTHAARGISVPVPQLPKIAEVVATRIRAQIVRGDLREGDRLPPETELLESLGVARQTLRESLRILESEGFIAVRRGAHGGPRVRLPTPEMVARYAGLVLEHQRATYGQLAEARELIEPYAVELLAQRGRPSDVASLRASLAEFDPENPEAELRSQPDFHIQLVELGSNTVLGLFARVLEHVSEVAVLREYVRATDSERSARELRRAHRAHLKVVDLIEAREAEEARAFWARHVREAAALMRGHGQPDDVVRVVALDE